MSLSGIDVSQANQIAKSIASDPRQLIQYIGMLTGRSYVYTKPFPAYLVTEEAEAVRGEVERKEGIGGFMIFIQEDDGSGKVNPSSNDRLALGIFIGREGFRPEGKKIEDLGKSMQRDASGLAKDLNPLDVLSKVLASPNISSLISGSYDEELLGRAVADILKAVDELSRGELIEGVAEGARIDLPDAGYSYPDAIAIKLRKGWIAFAPLNDAGYDFIDGILKELKGEEGA